MTRAEGSPVGGGVSVPTRCCGYVTAFAMALGSPLAGQDLITLEQRLSIGAEFGGITAVVPDDRGRIFAADYVNQTIWVFAPDGARLGVLGRRGHGPGEFTGLRDIATRGDTLYALDQSQQRITLFSLGGDQPRLARTMRLSVAGESPGLANYSLLAPSGSADLLVAFMPPTTPSKVPGQLRSVALRTVDGSGKVGATVATMKDMDWLIINEPHSVSPLPFGGRPVMRVGGDGQLYFGRTDQPTITRHTLGGRQLGQEELDITRLPVTQQDFDDLRASHVSNGGQAAARLVYGRVDQARRAGMIPSVKPLYKDFVVDQGGAVWVHVITERDQLQNTRTGLVYQTPGPDPVSLWRVFGPGGARRNVVLRGEVRPMAVVGTTVYAVRTDDDGVEHLVVYQHTTGER